MIAPNYISKRLSGKSSRLKSIFFQPKLIISDRGNEYKKEADIMSDEVTRIEQPFIQAKLFPITSVQRKCAHCEEEEKKAQRKEINGNETTPDHILESYVGNLNGGGQRLPNEIRNFYEPRFGYDFSNVRVHTDSVAAKSTQSINALAYTSGNNIVFNSDQYNTATTEGKKLLGHELTHVVQQQAAMKSGARTHYSPQSDAASLVQRKCSSCNEDEKIQRKEKNAISPVNDIYLQLAPTNSNSQTGNTGTGADFNTPPPDPACSAAKKGLGKFNPEIDCPTTDEDIGLEGHHFHFCLGSDVFALSSTPSEVRNFAFKQPALTFFKVHGFASTDGIVEDNFRLSCHRAIRVARELQNAGVRPDKIEIAKKGITEEFPGGPEFNRVVVVKPVPPAAPAPQVTNLPFSTVEEKKKAVKAAVDFINQGTYPLKADAYLSYWTCGQTPTVRDAVKKTFILVEGEPGVPKPDEDLGISEGQGLNAIVVSDKVLSANNQIDCLSGAIIDMGIHHKLKGMPGFEDFQSRHKAASFIATLAGTGPCTLPDGSNINFVQTDPRQNLSAPTCNPNVNKPTRFDQIKQPTGDVPQFFMNDVSLKALPSSVTLQFDKDTLKALMIADNFPITASADITLQGDQSQFSQFEVGFVQTIIFDNTTIEYVAGNVVKELMPAPIRDARDSSSEQPWFDANSIGIPDANGNCRASMSKKLFSEADFIFKNFRTGKTQSLNVIDTLSRKIRLQNALVAHRKGAPLDQFSTHLIDGTIVDVNMFVDVVGTKGTGSVDSLIHTDLQASPGFLRLTGPTPDQITREQKIIYSDTPSRDEAGQISMNQLIDIIKEITNTLSPKRMGLTHSSFVVKVFFDKATGRLPLTTDAVKARSPNIPEQLLKDISIEIFNRLRKRNFLKNSKIDTGAKDVIVKNDSNPANNVSDNVEASFSPVPSIALPDRPGVRRIMKQMWDQTQDSIDKKDPRGFSLTVYIDKDGNLRSFVVKKGDPPFITKDGFIIFREDCGGTFVDQATDTPLGSIHTHPIRTAPSFKDHEMARDSSSICGVEHFMINEDFVIKYDATSDSAPIDREKFLGK